MKTKCSLWQGQLLKWSQCSVYDGQCCVENIDNKLWTIKFFYANWLLLWLLQRLCLGYTPPITDICWLIRPMKLPPVCLPRGLLCAAKVQLGTSLQGKPSLKGIFLYLSFSSMVKKHCHLTLTTIHQGQGLFESYIAYIIRVSTPLILFLNLFSAPLCYTRIALIYSKRHEWKNNSYTFLWAAFRLCLICRQNFLVYWEPHVCLKISLTINNEV